MPPPTTPKCLTPGCDKPSAPAMKTGLCMSCHSEAKKLVESGKTTWAELSEMGLALASTPFTAEFLKRKSQE